MDHNWMHGPLPRFAYTAISVAASYAASKPYLVTLGVLLILIAAGVALRAMFGPLRQQLPMLKVVILARCISLAFFGVSALLESVNQTTLSIAVCMAAVFNYLFLAKPLARRVLRIIKMREAEGRESGKT